MLQFVSVWGYKFNNPVFLTIYGYPFVIFCDFFANFGLFTGQAACFVLAYLVWIIYERTARVHEQGSRPVVIFSDGRVFPLTNRSSWRWCNLVQVKN